MDLFSETVGFESEDLAKVTVAIANALELKPEHRFSDSYGGDISSFEDPNAPDAEFTLYYNHVGDITGPYMHEEDFPELGLILSIEQEGHYVDYEPKLKRMEKFKAILLHRSRYDTESKKNEVLFDLAKKRSKSKP
jgi:hypothetical protein